MFYNSKFEIKNRFNIGRVYFLLKWCSLTGFGGGIYRQYICFRVNVPSKIHGIGCRYLCLSLSLSLSLITCQICVWRNRMNDFSFLIIGSWESFSKLGFVQAGTTTSYSFFGATMSLIWFGTILKYILKSMYMFCCVEYYMSIYWDYCLITNS